MAIIELDQEIETPLTEFCRGNFRIRFGYARSKDAFTRDLRGEDYLVTRVEGNRLGFAICDGVGSSFFGGWASQILGEKIIRWLWEEDTRKFLCSDPPGAAAKSKLISALNAETEYASEIIARKDLSKLPNEMVRNVYRGKLEKSGSQSNFVCGYIEATPEGHGYVWLFWLGDARLRVWKDTEERTNNLHGKWESEQSWSTKFGVLGETFAYKSSPAETNKIVAYSDGLVPYEDEINHSTESSVLNEILANQKIVQGSDDISFLEIGIAVRDKLSNDDLVPLLRATATSLLSPEPPPHPKPDHEQRRKGSSLLRIALLVMTPIICSLAGLGIGYFMGHRTQGKINNIATTIAITTTPTAQPMVTYIVVPAINSVDVTPTPAVLETPANLPGLGSTSTNTSTTTVTSTLPISSSDPNPVP